MAKYYTNAFHKGDEIVHHYIEDGVRKVERVLFQPKIGIETTREGDVRDIFGKKIGYIDFPSIKEFSTWKYQNQKKTTLYDDIEPRYQFLSQHYPNDIPPDYKDIKIFILDIEVFSTGSFPHAKDADYPVTAIVIRNYYTKEKFVFGCQPYTSPDQNAKYFLCSNEKELLETFLDVWKDERPDILSGWNTEMFDIPYLVNRMRKLLPKGRYKWMSPYKKVTDYQPSKDFDDKSYRLEGISHIDYLPLYKKIEMEKLENYRLDTVLKANLDKGKLEYLADSLAGLYTGEIEVSEETPIESLDELGRTARIKTILKKELESRGLL